MTEHSETLVPDAKSELPELDEPSRGDEFSSADTAPLSDLMQVIEEKATRARRIPFTREAPARDHSTLETSTRDHSTHGSSSLESTVTDPTDAADAQVLRGVCNVCGWRGSFRLPERGREGHFCGNCASTSRHRMVIHGLSMVLKMAGQLPVGGSAPIYAWPRDQHLRILEPSGRGPYPSMLEDRFQYHGIEYDPSRVDSDHPRRGYGDIQRLHFADESYDLVIASDVFEHVRDDDAGFTEILRVLRHGGALVLTVPYEHEKPTTVARVDISGETDVNVLPPVYHSGGGLTLVYRDYGRDLLTKLRGIGFTVMHVDAADAEQGITRQSLILAFKADFVEWVSEGAADGVIAASGGEARSEPGAEGMHESTPYLGPLLHQRLYLLLKFNLRGLYTMLKQFCGRSL